MKIALVELESHIDSLEGLCKIFEDYPQPPSIFTSRKIFMQLQEESFAKKYHWVLQESNEPTPAFLTRIEPLIGQNDVVFFNTIDSNFKSYSGLNLSPVSILRIHDAHAFLAPYSHIRIIPTPYFLFKATSYIIRKMLFLREVHYTKKIVDSFDLLNFPDDAVRDYVIEKKFVDPDRITPSLPLRPAEKEYTPHSLEKDQITFTITGGIDQRRRNYEEVVDAFSAARNKSERKIRLVLLGNGNFLYGRKIIQKLQRLQSERFELIYFMKVVPQSEFNSWMQKTDVVIIPTLKEGQYKIFKEVYGQSKITGGLYDIVRYGVPAVITRRYQLTDAFKSVLDSYENPYHLSELILKYADGTIDYTQRRKSLIEMLHSNLDADEAVKRFVSFLNALDLAKIQPR